MALTFPVYLAFVGAAAMAPVVLFAALRFAVSGKRRAFGRQVIWWGAIGALGFVLADIVLGLLLRARATIVGASVGAAAGFSVLSVSYTVLQRVLARRRLLVADRHPSPGDAMDSFKQSSLAVNTVLFEHWDPIGVRGANGSRDEYLTYVPQLLALVNRDAPDEELAAFLGEVEGRAMRVVVSPLSERLRVATRIKAVALGHASSQRDG
ncbi:MAG: hypothetical protein ABI120_07425 [Gemmatimonadaceae bacterium]